MSKPSTEQPEEADLPLRIAAGNILREMIALRGFGIALLIMIVVSGVWTIQRNQTWRDAGSLWYDIAEKSWRGRTLDPDTGVEVPRFERGRVYNNIGLFLYRKGKQLYATRRQIKKMATALAMLKIKTMQNMNMTNQNEMTQTLLDLRRTAKKLSRELLARVPSEFTALLAREKITPDNAAWDPLRPAEMCYQRALYHRPNWMISRLNYSLIFRLRRAELSRNSDAWFRFIMQEEGHLQHAQRFGQSTPKSLFHYSTTLFDLGTYWLQQEEYKKALDAFSKTRAHCVKAFAALSKKTGQTSPLLSNIHATILNAHIGQAKSLAALDHPQEAIEILEAIMQKVPLSNQKPIRRLLRSIRAAQAESPPPGPG